MDEFCDLFSSTTDDAIAVVSAWTVEAQGNHDSAYSAWTFDGLEDHAQVVQKRNTEL